MTREGRGRFWYAVSSGAGRSFVLVDPTAGTREPAFDHARLAAALTPPGNPLEVPSPDTKPAVSRRGHDLWARSLSDGREWALTTDGEPH